MSINLFFWIKGLEIPPVPVDLGEPLGLEFRLIYAPSPEVQEFLIFYDDNQPLDRWNKAALGKWQEAEKEIEITKFTFPAEISLTEGWRNSMVTWNLNSPIDTDKCYERYKLNRGANFSDRTLYLIDLAQQVSGKPISEALFDAAFDSGNITINKYQSAVNENDCQLGDEESIDSEIENLRVIPPGELPENFEFEILALNYIG